MNEMYFPRWLAAIGVLGGVVISVGLPYVVLAHGGDLSSGARVAMVITGVLAGGILAIASAVVGIAVPAVVTRAGVDLEACCEPEPPETRPSAD
jgi:hypothetical protein